MLGLPVLWKMYGYGAHRGECMPIEGCIHLLQEKKPIQLIGSVVGWIEETGNGWVKINLVDGLENVSVTANRGILTLTFSFEIALLLAGWLLCLINQNKAFRSQRGLEKVSNIRSHDIDASYTDEAIEISFELIEGMVTMQEVDEQVEISLVEGVAEVLGFSLFEQLGKSTASTANLMIENPNN
jgi:hypothetical protein